MKKDVFCHILIIGCIWIGGGTGPLAFPLATPMVTNALNRRPCLFLDNTYFIPGSFLRAVSSEERLLIMKKYRKGQREPVAVQRIRNYDDIKKISKQAGVRAIERCQKRLEKEEQLNGKSLENAVLGVGVQEKLNKHEVDNLIDQQNSAKAVFWSRHKF